MLDLLGQMQAFTSRRFFRYELPQAICKSFYLDTVEVTLFDNGTCLLLWDQGNMDHNSNDHRIGVFEETADSVKTRTISIWRDDASVEEQVFVKKSEDELFFDDNKNNPHVREKTLVLKNNN